MRRRTPVLILPASKKARFYRTHSLIYSVPTEFVGRRVTVAPAAGMIYVYHDGRLIAVRKESSAPINYEPSDYLEAMAASYKGGGDIEQMAMESLACLADLGRR